MHAKKNTPSDPVTIHIVDDEPNARKALQRLLNRAGFTTELHASGSEFLENYNGEPACLILDLHMPGLRGEKLVEEILQRNLNLVVLVVTGHATVASAVFLTRAGAIDVIEKPFDNEHLLETVRIMVRKARRVFAQRALADDFKARMASLTSREKDVFDLLLAGFSSADIGEQLDVSKKTVDIHRSRVMSKMGAASVAELIVSWTTLVERDQAHLASSHQLGYKPS